MNRVHEQCPKIDSGIVPSQTGSKEAECTECTALASPRAQAAHPAHRPRAHCAPRARCTPRPLRPAPSRPCHTRLCPARQRPARLHTCTPARPTACRACPRAPRAPSACPAGTAYCNTLQCIAIQNLALQFTIHPSVLQYAFLATRKF